MVSQTHMDKKTIRRTNRIVHAHLAAKRAQREACAATKAKIVALFDACVLKVDIELPL